VAARPPAVARPPLRGVRRRARRAARGVRPRVGRGGGRRAGRTAGRRAGRWTRRRVRDGAGGGVVVRAVPTLRQERALLSSGARLVAGMDEVGRGALAGPVSVGVVVVDAATRTGPKGVADSKLLTPAAREAIAPAVRRWAVAWGVGHAGPAEIDEVGIIAALRLAGRRALAQVRQVCGDVDVVVLDGKHDWLSRPALDLFAAL